LRQNKEASVFQARCPVFIAGVAGNLAAGLIVQVAWRISVTRSAILASIGSFSAPLSSRGGAARSASTFKFSDSLLKSKPFLARVLEWALRPLFICSEEITWILDSYWIPR